MKKKLPAPKKTRDLAKSRKEILDAAFFEVFSKGFQGVSVDDIVGKTNLTKGAFYHQFATKLELGYALVDEVIKPMILDRWITPLNEYSNPLEGILAQLQKHIGSVGPEHLKLGCPLNNLVQEMSPIDGDFKLKLQAALNLWIDEMEKHIKRAKKAGIIKKTINAREVAQFVVMSHEGFYGLMKGLEDPTLFKSFFKTMKNYFNTLQD